MSQDNENTERLTFEDKIGVLDPNGIQPNPLTNKPYSDDYKNLASIWSTYPVYFQAENILRALNENQVIFLSVGTGGGKTALTPKLALHFTNYKGRIAITLPKRIVALSAATYSAKTLDVKLGTSVGYVYKGSDKSMLNDQNHLIYMTDGYLVMEFVKDPTLSKYNIIIIDEAHERRVQIDLLMLFLKNILLSGKRPDLKVIIMSATINGPKYQNYFAGIKSEIINVSGQPNHPIEVHFLDKPTDSYMRTGFELIETLIHENLRGDILFFITTSNEALQLCKNIRPKYPRVYCIEVYADMDKNLKIYAESRDKFLELGDYDQKLVMATNVAESSLTIDGLKYVVDSGFELQSRFDPDVYGQILGKQLITQAQAIQRRGRVGRTEPGICYHLLTKDQFDNLEPYPTPDILKQDITMDIIKIMQITDSKTFSEANNMLQQLMDPPKQSFINVSYDLFNMYQIVDANDKLTRIGSLMTQFSSLSVNRVMFLIYSFELHCAREAAIILAMMEFINGKITNIFYKLDPVCEANCERQAASLWLDKMIQKRGDHLTYLKIFQEYKNASDRKAWGNKYGIRLDLFNNIDKTANQYFRKILNFYRNPEQSRIVSSSTNITKNIIQALIQSHKHLTANKLRPIFSKRELEGRISKDSVVRQKYNKRELSNKKFIYDELTNINGKWEFRTITII
ncbi:HrpA-like helicase [Acanthamoeba polyphaga moumouvirus]|uniref:HrpA-like helicase n=1 Tax=Acanthamoeba polyphaga moumouvirus TaxID=1269028 RepID=L7RCZ1_9VIRU|nr:HrpA-like helicase [Acanthamoeba polyphaga moumouvirus]AGC02106.1 HrpA-like helicase [Acanthamoeba polyphaga moumouvirus]